MNNPQSISSTGNQRQTILIIGLAVTALILIAGLLIPSQLETSDRVLLNTEFRVRGERPVDSSVVVLYFSSDDISILGDLPLKRSYYALLVNALNDLGAKAIGFDIGFSESDPEHQEYDRVFTSTVAHAGNVAVSGYFRSLTSTPQPIASSPAVHTLIGPSEHFPAGVGPEFPFPDLMQSAAGFGHSNLTARYDIPAAVLYQQGAVPAFSLELLRLAAGAAPGAISFDGNALTVPSGGAPHRVPFGTNGELMINYTGGMRSIPAYSAVTLLQSYDAAKAGGEIAAEASAIRGKIVIVGIIAAGRSAFISTPYDAQFPTVGMHAMAIHNAVDGTFLRRVPAFVVFFLCGLFGFLCTILLLPSKHHYGAAGFAALAVGYPVVSYLMFSMANIVLPLTLPLVTILAVCSTLVLYRQRQYGRQLEVMTDQATDIRRQLQDKESLLAVLERELNEIGGPTADATPQATGTDARRAELLADVKRFKDEVHQLKQRAEEEQVVPAEADELREFCGIYYHPAGPMNEVIDFIRMIADNDAPVLILGESGTGKELVARAIHDYGRRKDKPFVAVNCGALTETLLESELFGHEKGSFTGAVRERAGRFEAADHGVIFLDEIGETSEAFQVKMLRVLQEGTYERVGGGEPRKTDVRVVAATNRDIKKEVAEHRFREDLFYRLNVFTVTLPPLRDRPKDLPYLIRALVARESTEAGKGKVQISAGVMDILLAHPWKGNIRELQGVVKRAVVLAQADRRDTLHTKDLPEEMKAAAAAPANLEGSILASLRAKGFSRSAITETASELGGLNRGTVAEYFRGECFSAFVLSGWKFEEASKALAGSTDPTLYLRANKKLNEYLRNAVENVDSNATLEETRALSRPKYKNLAQKYHSSLDSIIESYHSGQWTLTPEDPSKDA